MRKMIREDLTPAGCPLFAFVLAGLFDEAVGEDGDEGDHDLRAEVEAEKLAETRHHRIYGE